MKQDAQAAADTPIREIGRILAQNREAQDISLADVKVRLKVRTAKIRAIEEGNLADLPDIVFTKGFIRNYARLLHVEDEIAPFLAQLDNAQKSKTAAAPVHSTTAKSVPSEPGRKFPVWLKLLLPLAVIVAGVMWWQGKSVRQVEQQTQQEAAALGSLPEMPAVEHENVLIVPMPDNTAENSEVGGKTETPAANVSGSINTETPAKAGGKTETPAANVSGSVNSADNAPSDNVLNISIRYRSFLSVRDAHGKTLIDRIVPGGSSHQFSGTPPYSVRIGYASGSTVQMNGTTYDLSAHTRGKTATLTIPPAP